MRWLAEVDPLDELMQWVHNQILDAGDEVWIWFANFNNGVGPSYIEIARPVHDQMVTLAMATYVTIVVVGGLVVMTQESIQTRYTLKEIAPRIIMGLGLVWASNMINYGARVFTRDIVIALLSYDKGDLEHWAFDELEPYNLLDAMHAIAFAKPLEYSLISVLTAVLLLVGVVILAATNMMRWLAWLAVFALAPLALACHGLPFTEGVARLWWKTLGACMASSIGQAGCIYLWRWTMWHGNGELSDEFGGGQDIEPMHQYLSLISIALAIWAMWKVHALAFQWARGRPTRIPGARMIAGVVAWRAMNRIGLGRHRGHRARPRTPKSRPHLPATKSLEPAPQLPPSGWNDGWDRDNDSAGLSPARGWRPRIDHGAAKRAIQRHGKPPKPRINHNREALVVHPSADGGDAKVTRPPRLPSPSRHIPVGKPTPTPEGRLGVPPRLRTTPAVATSTPSLPQHSDSHARRSVQSTRRRIPTTYPSQQHRHKDRGDRS